MPSSSTSSPSSGKKNPSRSCSERSQDVWPEVEKRLRAAREPLETSGSIHPRPRKNGGPGYAVRFRDRRTKGRKINRSIALGTDPDVVRRARELLALWQERRDPRRTLNPALRQYWASVRQCSKLFGHRDGLAFMRHCLDAGNDRSAIMRATGQIESLMNRRRLRRKGGRPRKGRLDWAP